MSISGLARNAKYLKTLTIALVVKYLDKFCNLCTLRWATKWCAKSPFFFF